jgi:hypothetical protein
MLNDAAWRSGSAGGSAIYTTFAGEPVNNNDVLVRYTYFGDANLDGIVSILDFNILATNFGKSGMTFGQGNFDYGADGTVNILDFNLLATNFGKQVAAPIIEPKTAAIVDTRGAIGTDAVKATLFSAAPIARSSMDLLQDVNLL